MNASPTDEGQARQGQSNQGQSNQGQAGAKRKRFKTTVVVLVTFAILVPGGYGFTAKFIQFIRTLATDDEGTFTIIPISNYLLVALGMTCLLIWAVVHGMFRDVEGPKYTLLDREASIDRASGVEEE